MNTMWLRESSVFLFVNYIAFIISANGCLLCSEEDSLYMKYDLHFMYQKYLKEKTKISGAVEKTYKLFFNQEFTKNNPKMSFTDRTTIRNVNAIIAEKIRMLLGKYKGIENSVIWKQLDDQKNEITNILLNRSRDIQLLVCNNCEMESYEIVNCQTCQILKIKCNDPIICKGTNMILIIVPAIGLLLLLLAACGGLYYWKERKDRLDDTSENQLPPEEVISTEEADDPTEEKLTLQKQQADPLT